MNDFDRINTLNTNMNDDIVNENENNGDSDNNITHNLDNDATPTNTHHRNNFTARDHLFQAMFSRIALTYDRTFPPFARRFIEFMLLITALSVLFILIYIHLAFVKAPITCLDNFSFEELTDHDDASLKHMVIRVEILSNPPLNYGLFNSYSKEYDDMNAATYFDKNSSSELSSKNDFTQLIMFFNVIHKKCHKGIMTADKEGKDYPDNTGSTEDSKDKVNADQNQSESSFYKLFHFPINPIIEKAEYWREKLSVRAMAPFRQTFNDLEVFAKSVFTEEKYIMEYSLEYGLLRLSPQTRERLNIPVHFILLDANKDKCFGNALSRFILEEFVGYDQIIIGSLKRLAERQSGKGYVRNVVSGEHYRFVNSWMSRTSYLAAGFIMIIFTLSVSMLLRYSHHQIFVFIVDLLRMLENNLQFSFPAAPLLTVVLALVGMEAIMSEFFNDTSTAFYTILIIWLADQYEAVCCRTYVSKRHWPRYFYLYHFAFYAYHYRFNGQFSGLALLCSWLFIQHSMFFFFHHYELPRLMQGIAVRAIMDSLIVERAENTSLTPTSMYPNEDDDSDMPGGDRRDNDEDPGSSNMPSLRSTNGTLPRMGDYKPPPRNDNIHREDAASPSLPSGENHSSYNNSNSDSLSSTRSIKSKPPNVKKRFTIKTVDNSSNLVLKEYSVRFEKPDFMTQGREKIVNIAPNLTRHILSYRDEIIETCIRDNLTPMSQLKLSESLIDQVYSIIIIMATMVCLSGGLSETACSYLHNRVRLPERRPKIIINQLVRSKDARYKRIDINNKKKEMTKPRKETTAYFTVSRDYNHFGNRFIKNSSTFDDKVVSRRQLMFADKYAVAMKMLHQVSLSVERISNQTITANYNYGIKVMARFKESFPSKEVSQRICNDVGSSRVLTATETQAPNKMIGDGVCVSDGSVESIVNGSNPISAQWCQKKFYESFPVQKSENMERVDSTFLHIQESVANEFNEVTRVSTTTSSTVVHLSRTLEVPMEPVENMAVKNKLSLRSPGLRKQSSGFIYKPILYHRESYSSVSVNIGTDLESVVTNIFHNKSLRIDFDSDNMYYDVTINDDIPQLHHFSVEEELMQDKYCNKDCMTTLLTDLRAYLDTTVDDIFDPAEFRGDCTIPLFDLFPEDY